MAEETLAPLGACISQMLPPGLSQRTDTFIRLNLEREIDESVLSPLEKRLVHLLQKRGDLRGRQVDAAIRQVEWRGTLRKLTQKGIVHTRAILPPPRVRPKTVRKVMLAIPPDEIDTLEMPLSRVQTVQERRMKILRMLSRESGLVEPSWVFAQTGGNNGDLKMLAEAGLIDLRQDQVWRDPLEETSFVTAEPPVLTHDQDRFGRKSRPVSWLHNRVKRPHLSCSTVSPVPVKLSFTCAPSGRPWPLAARSSSSSPRSP